MDRHGNCHPTQQPGMERQSLRTALWGTVGVVCVVVSITVLHYTTSLHSVLLHQVFQRLHYLPIVVATDYRHEASSRHCCPGRCSTVRGCIHQLGNPVANHCLFSRAAQAPRCLRTITTASARPAQVPRPPRSG